MSRAAEATGDYGWYRIIDTSLPAGQDFAEQYTEVLIEPADHYLANPRSTVVLAAHAT
jgi:isoamylase